MKYYIEWNYEPEIVKITKKRPTNVKIENCKDSLMCSFNVYKIEDRDESMFSVFETEQKVTELYFLEYHEDGQGGSYHNEYEIYIFTNSKDLIEEATDIYSCEHNCDEHYHEDESMKNDSEECIKFAMKKLIDDGELIFGGYTENSFNITHHLIEYRS